MSKPPIKNLRWYIAGLLCLASALNYLDRQSLAMLFDTIKLELHLKSSDYGVINAWFLLSYGVMYAVSGRIIDVVGTRRGFTLFVAGWSVSNMMYMFARTVGQFASCGFLLGVFEPGSFTGGVRAVSEWFPMRERALAVGVFNSGTAIGSMACAPIVSFIAVTMGWRAAFLITGVLGLIWVAVWWLVFKLPKDHPRIGEQERQMILADQSEEKEQASPLSRLLRMRETWGCVLARVLTDPISYFLLFWIPPYFQHVYHFNLKEVGMFAWIPYTALAVGNLFSGLMPRWLINRGWDLNRARKSTMFAMTCLMPIFCVLVTQISSPVMAVTIVSCIMFCHASWGNIALPAEVFPKNAVGTVTGLGGALGSLMGAVSQLCIGSVVEAYGCYTLIFITCAVLYPLAFLTVQLLVGKLGVVRKV